MKSFKRIAAVSALSMGMLGGSAYAATDTTTFNVSLTVTNSCTLVATDMLFTGVGILGSNNDAQSAITATCTPGTVFDVGLNDGNNASGTQRRMSDGTNFVNYELYTDSARTTRWDDIGGTTTQGDNGSDLDGIVIFDVYGRVPSQTNQPAGVYTDVITVTVSF